MTQPDMSIYYSKIQGYEQFLSLCVLTGILIAYFAAKRVQPSKPLWMPPLWASVALGALLRIPTMFQAFWYDEAFTSVMTSVPLPQMAIAITGDVHPPLYYLIVKMFTILLGHHDLAMRLPAYISGVLLIVVMYRIGSQYNVGRATALIIAILPSSIYYSTEARYPMFLALMLAVAWLAIEQRRWLSFALALSATALVHVNAWLYVALLCLIWLYRHRNPLAVIFPVTSVALWLPVALIQARDVSDGFWLIQYLPIRHLLEMSITAAFSEAAEMLLPAIITIVMMVASVWTWRKQIRPEWLLLVAGVPAAQALVGIVWHPVYLPRTLIFSTLLLIIPVAWSIQHYRMRFATIAALFSLIFSTGIVYTNDRNGLADDAIALCDSYNLIYTTNVHSAILAEHFSRADVLLYPYGNSTAQQLPETAQRALFNLGFIQPEQDACLYSQISVFNTPQEMAHLTTILSTRPHVSYKFSQSETGYYLVTVFEEKLR